MAKKIIFLIIAGLVIFALGTSLGLFYRTAPTGGSEDAVKFLSSKATSFNANGIVTKISGRDISLNSNGETLVIPVNNSAKINLFVQPTAEENGVAASSYYRTAQFSEIKVGYRLNISLGLSSSNKIEGQEVFIFIPLPGEKVKGS